MGKIYKDQTVEISITSDTALESATNTVRYRTPSGTTYEAEPDDVSESTVTISMTLNECGVWAFWIYSIFPDDSNIPSEPIFIRVYKEGT